MTKEMSHMLSSLQVTNWSMFSLQNLKSLKIYKERVAFFNILLFFFLIFEESQPAAEGWSIKI